MIQIPVDQEARDKSIRPEKSMLLIAGAGSGKTEQLSKRNLVLCETSESPKEIICTTFTRKAGAEMRSRIIKTLKASKNDGGSRGTHQKETYEIAERLLDKDNKEGWDIARNPNQLNITTLDSLCLNIINSMPMSTQYTGTVNPIENTRPIYNQAIEKLLDNPNYAEDCKTLVELVGINKSSIFNVLVHCLATRDQWTRNSSTELITEIEVSLSSHVKSIVDVFFNRFNELSKEEMLSTILTVQANLEAIGKTLNENDVKKARDGNDGALIRIYCNIISTSDGKTLRKSISKASGLNPADKEEKKNLCSFRDMMSENMEMLEIFSTTPDKSLSFDDKKKINAISNCTKGCLEELEKTFLETNELDFIAITSEAIKILNACRQKEVPESLKFKHILIDEFQDTSTQQHELLKLLLEKSGKTHKSLFCVGDPKQSLYLFRSAALGLFINAEEQGIKGAKLENEYLSVNFRSKKSIVDWVNRVFEIAMPTYNESKFGAAKYTNTDAFSNELLESSINHTVIEKSDDPEGDKKLEAKLLVDDIQESLIHSPNESNAILVRSRGQLIAITDELKGRGISYTGVKLIKLNTRQPIIDILNLAELIHDPHSPLPLFGILRSPMVGLKQIDLLKIFDNKECIGLNNLTIINKALLIESISDDAVVRIQEFKELYISAISMLGHTPFNCIIEKTWKMLKGNCFTEDLSDSDIKSIFKIINECEADNFITDWGLLQSKSENLYVSPQEDADLRIQIMTIHQSKGLEFDNIYLPSLAQQGSMPKREVISYFQTESKGNTEFIMAPKPRKGEDSVLFEHCKNIVKRKEMLEVTRVLYVATTRAVKRIYTYSTIKTKDNEIQQPPKNSFLGHIWAAVENEIRDAFYTKYEAIEKTRNTISIEKLDLEKRTNLLLRKKLKTGDTDE